MSMTHGEKLIRMHRDPISSTLTRLIVRVVYFISTIQNNLKYLQSAVITSSPVTAHIAVTARFLYKN